MEEIRRVANETVMRACGFALLGIFCFMFGLSFDGGLAFKAGGTLTLLMVGVLSYKAHEAKTKDHRRTEMWLYLPKEQRPPPAYAQFVSSTVLRETYFTFAYWTAIVSIALWVLAVVFAIAGQ